MTVLPIRTLGDPVLRTPAEPVTFFDAKLRRLADDMIETMYAAPGLGLAAPQVGVGLRLFVFDVDWEPNGDTSRASRRPRVVVNPVLELGPGEQTDQEGCLSVPGHQYSTTRAATATVRGVDLAGDPVVYSGDGLLARCLQHETDHLDGMLYLDRLTGLSRRAAQRALRDAQFGPPGGDQRGAVGGGLLRALRRQR
ncbi:MAG: peptide deformylase [Frankia sp.]|nr:peptide deformylase [Frankia sp.]